MSAIDDLLNSANERRSTAAGPQGFYDAAVRQQQQQQSGSAIDQLLNAHGGAFVPGQQTDMTGTYRSWYTGQNLQGTGSGWDTNFQREFQAGVQRAYEEGRQLEYFAQDDATGVVTWDNAVGKGRTRYGWGDVIVRGKKVGNVYEDFDRHTANVMMGDYVIETGARKAKLNQERDIEKAWEEEISEYRAKNTQMAEVAPRAKAFEEAVEKRVEDNEDSRWKIAFSAGAGSSVLGAGVGSFFTPVGTAIGAGVMFGVGFLGAYLNSDSLQYQVARSREQYEYASREGAGIQAALSGIAQNTMSIGLSPLGNLLQGTHDQIYGEGVGKGAIGGSFHETNEEGQRKAGAAWQVAELIALLGDSALQFASPAGRLAYQAQMTTQISSGMIGLLPGQGQWDERLVRQNSVWTRDEYNPETGQWEQKFDAGNALAGIGSVAIDAVQLGAISSLSRQTDRLAGQVAARTGQTSSRWAKPFGGNTPFEKLNLSREQRAALKAGAELETRSGFKFVIAEGGEIVGRQRATLAMLAPSEGLQAMTAKMLARRDAARRAGAVRAEDLYQAASDLALGQRGLTAMLVNAVGEGQEEALQAILDPLSQDHKMSAEEIIRAGLAGAATGFGMTFGARLGRPSQDMQMYAAAMLGHERQTNGALLPYEQWQKMSHLEKRTMVKSASGLAESLTNSAFDKIERDRIRGIIGGAVEAQALEDYTRDEQEATLRTGAQATDQASPIVMHESYSFRPEAVATSHNQLLEHQMERTRAAVLQLNELNDEIAKLKTDPAQAELLAVREASKVSLRREVQASQVLERTIARYVAEIDEAFERDDLAAAESSIDELNVMLEDMFDMTANTFELVMKDGSTKTVTLTEETLFAYSKAASRLMTRDPADSEGSWPILLPQVNKVYARRGANGLYAVSQIILKAIRGDYDGDKTRPLQQLVVPDNRYREIRAGSNILGAGTMPEIGSTAFEQQLAIVAMQSWDSRNIPLRDAARRVPREIERELFERYQNRAQGRNLVPTRVILEVTKAAQDTLRSGGDVREKVLEILTARAGGRLLDIGRGEHVVSGMPRLSNEMYWVANMVTRHMSEFQNAYARLTPLQGEELHQPKAAAPAAQTATDVPSGTPARAATEGGTVANVLPGTNMFRMFQKLHYTLWETTEKFAGWATDAKRDEYMQLVQLYEQLSQGVNEQRLERMSPSDQVLGDVMTWLQRMAASPMELQRLGLTQMGDMAIIANTSVPQMVFERDDNGVERLRFTGKDISIGQHLLYLALHKFKKANFEVWDRDATLSAAYNNLIQLTKPQTQGDKNSFPGNAEMAFVTIFEGVRAYDLVGIEAVSLGVNRTVGQIYRELVNEEDRQERKYALRTGGAYAEADKDATIPFSPAENRAGASNAYKALIDALFSAADSSISKNRTGQNIGATTGRLAKKSNDRGESIQETYRSVLQLLQTLEPRKGGYSAADVSRIANQYREFGSMLMKAIPPELMPVVFRRYDEVTGNPVFASWFYEVWTQPSAEQAEMSYFRNLTLHSWFAQVHAIDLDSAFSDTAVKGLAYHKLDSRMHRIIFNLAARSTVDPTPLKAFMTRFNEAQSVEKFMKYVNTDPSLPTEGAPYVAWVDDVAEFDPERAGGGWSSQLSTPTLMEHINNLRSTADRMVTDIQRANERSKQDLKTARRIERWHKHLKNPEDLNQWVDWKKDKDEYERFVALLKESSKRRMANGPRAMLQHTAHLVYGLYGPAHAKGAIAEQMAANAALEALDNAFGFLTSAERALGDLTTHNEDSVAKAPQMILRDGGRTMTRHGAEVTWELDAVEAMLPLMTDAKKHALMRSVLFDTVIELDTDNVARRKFLMGSTLDEVMNRSTVKELFHEKKNPDLTQAMKFLTKVEQGLRDTQKHQIEQKVTELVLLRTTALDHTASFEEIQSMTVQAYMDMAALLQIVGRTKKRPGEEDPAELAYRQLREAALVASISAAYNIDAKVVNGSLSNLQDLVKKELLQAHDDRIAELIKQLRQSGLSATTRGSLEDALKAEKGIRKAKQAKVDRMFDLNVTDQIVAQYHYSTEASDAEKHQRQTDLMEYVYRNGELMQAAGPALITVQTIKNHYRERAIDQKLRPLKLPDKAWETLSNVIISVEIQHLLTVGPASKPPPPYPSALEPGEVGLDKRKYWDHSGSYAFDFLSEDDTTGIVEVARDLAQRQAGMVTAQFDEVDIINKVKSTLMRDGSIGTWTPIIPILNIESYELLTGASANPSISMHGLLQRRWGAAMMATRRQTTDTVADATVTLTAEDLNWTESNLFHDVTVTAGNGVQYQRPLAMMNNRFAEELSFTYTAPDGTRSGVIDLMSQFNVARQWSGAQGDTTRFREVNILRLSEELERLLLQAHPDAGQVELEQMRDSIEVSMRFVNPDAQPASTAQELRDHANSVWHEGTVYATDGDVGPSLIEAFFYGIGALNARGQQAALDTRKLGLMGIEDYNRPEFGYVLEMEKAAGTDFARMLALKTNVLMDTKISKGKPIDPQFYNAAFKLMKLKHWVEGTVPGTDTKTRWSAEQVIAWQMQNPGKDIFGAEGPLENAKLWIPSDQVLADMLGDIGYGGVTGRALKRGVELDLDTIPRYSSQWTEDMESKFPIANNSKETSLLDTDVARQSFVQDLNVSSYLTPQERSRFQRRVEQMNRQVSAAQQQRVDTQRKSFNPKKNLQQNMTEVLGWVSKRDMDISFPPGLEFLEAKPDNLLQRTKDVLASYTNERAAEVGRSNASFWIYQEEGMSNAEEGRLTKSDISGGLNIIPGEVVFFDVAPYRNEDPAVAREKAMRQIEFFVSKGAAIMVGSSRGSDTLIVELQYAIQSAHRYQRYEGDSTILVPDVFDESSFQNVAAARSRLVVPTPVNISRQAVSMLLLDQEVEENSMLVPVRPGRRTKFDSMQAVFDLLPTDASSKFNTVNTRDEAEMVGNWITGLGDINDPGVEMLRQEALRHLYVVDSDGQVTKKLKKGVTRAQVDKETQAFDEAWKNLVKAMPARVEAGTTLPLPGETNIEFIPLLNSQTNEMMLYRHGYKYPKDMDYQRQLRNQVPGSSGVRGVVMYGGKRESAATVHPSAMVVDIVPSPGRGLRMEMEVPVPELGSKIVVEHNGMKYVRTSAPENLVLPEGAIFGDIEIDGFASLHDVMSKEATDGLLTSFQNAFAMFGIDFTEDVKKFFGTTSTDTAVRTLRQIAALGEKQSVEDIYELQSLLAGSSSYLSLIEGLVSTNSLAGTNFEQWGSRLQEETPEAAIVRAMIVYLMSPNANVDAILSSSGFHVNNPSLPNARSLKMPELFTRAFDLAAPDSPIKTELATRINAKLAPGYHLDVNSWEFEAQTSDGRTLRGMLQFGESHVSEDNPLLNIMAQERKDFQTASVHQSLMNKIGTGGTTRLTNPSAKKRIARLDAMRRQRLPEEAEPGSLWRDLTFVNPQTYGPGSRWQERTGLEHRYYNQSIDRMKLYRQEIDFSSDAFKNDRVAIEQAITRVVDRLKLRPSDAELVHYWIRQVLYHPAESSDQEAFSGDLAPSDVLGALEHIHDNIENGYLPTYNGAGPSFFSAHDLAVLFHASQRNENGWRPFRKENDPTSPAGRDDLGEWVAIAFGQAINRSVPFDPIYRLDFSGFMNTYQQVLRNSGYMMDITLDKDYQRRLLDPETNELLTVTVDPVEQTRLTEQVLAATANLEYDDLMVSQSNPNSVVWRERRLKARARWRARRDVHPVKAPSARDFLRNGTEHINRDSDMHSLQRIVIALRHGTAMLNPGLYVSMIPEQGLRMLVSETTNALTGESTLRSVSAVQRGLDRAVGAVTGGRGNFKLAQYTDKQVRDLNQLFTTLGNDGAFTSLIIKDMMWQRDKNSPGKVVDFFEKYWAGLGNKWQDPTWGTTQKSLARHYVEAILRSIESMPTKYALTTDSVIAALRTDPAYFARNHLELHEMASNFVVDFRSLRNTPMSLAIKAIYEPMSQSHNMPIRFAGTLIKLQAMYSTYNMNILTTITGMQGYSDLLAVLLDGRRKPNSVISHWYKALNNQKVTDAEFETMDMSSVLDGVTIANSFIRGGVTQTGLFLLGMASGGILSGEDEEAKRRRRLAEAQGAPLIMDPRRLEADFRNKDVIFLDWLSPKLSAFFRVQGDDGSQGARAAAQISWVLKPFLSPIMGMERFFMTGDFSYVTHGFMDAVGSLPLFNKGKWDDAVRTAHELEKLAADEQQAGTPTSLKNSMYLLTSAVAVYESMLIENMFVNSLYTGFDMFDRDPTRLVLRDSDGDIQRTIENDARPNDVALTDYAGEDGDIGQGYKKRDPVSASLAAYSENNFTAAALLSLFKPIHHQEFLRGNMPVRTQTIKIPELSENEAKVAVILATLNGQQAAGQLERRLSLDEVTSLIRTKAIQAQDWDTFNNLDAVAEQFYLSDANPMYDPLSIIGPDGQEVLTKSGHAALFKGLQAGTISLDDPEMRGIAISWDARREIEKDFLEDFTRQGIDIGLTRTQAENRAKRLMMGPIEDKTIVGFGDILWDDRIPSSADAKYKQLNTTYVTGPDGFPWATGYKRGGAPGGGFWSLLGGLKRPTIGMTDAIDQDGRMNSADLIRGINTGLRGLVPMNDTEQIPTDWEQTQKILEALEGHNESFDGYVPNSRDSGNGSGTFYRRGYSRSYGGGGGYSSRGYSPTIYWSRQPTLPRGSNVYGNSARNLFWDNANIRRTTIRRERYQSSRGRLNQWQ